MTGAHQFLGWLVCNRCGYRVLHDKLGRATMKAHVGWHLDEEAR